MWCIVVLGLKRRVRWVGVGVGVGKEDEDGKKDGKKDVEGEIGEATSSLEELVNRGVKRV